MSTARELAKRNIKRARTMEDFVTDALKETGKSAVRTARKYSSGTIPLSEFYKAPGKGPYANHPYGYGTKNSRGPRGGIPYGDPGIVNKQSGEFWSRWHYEVDPEEPPILLVINNSPHAKYMEESDRMRFRPIGDKILKAERPGFLARLATARRKAMQQA